MEKNSKNISTCDETSPKGPKKSSELKQKKLPNKWQKRFAVGCLAVLMCGTALFGVACTPTTATSGTQGATPSSSANGGGNLGTNTSPFNLKPETDPVVYTTASGLEIKCSNALTNTNLASYTYFTMGEYEGTPVNWVIIGYDPSVSNLVGEYTGDFNQGGLIQGGHNVNSTLDDSPMGNAIRKEFFAISNQAVENDEIGDGCVLCLSERSLTNCYFDADSPYTSCYSGSDCEVYALIKSWMFKNQDNEIENTLNIEPTITSLISETKIKTSYYNGNSTVIVENMEYLFLLAYNTGQVKQNEQNFIAQNYLKTDNLRICYDKNNEAVEWWSRTGNSSHYDSGHMFNAQGTSEGGITGYNLGVRPAFVMKLW